MNSTSIENLYHSTGLVLRVFNQEGLKFEISDPAAERTSCASFVLGKIPIAAYGLAGRSRMGLFYYTDRIHLLGAFKRDVYSDPNIDPNKPLSFTMKNGKKYVSFPYEKTFYRNYESISAIREKVMRMHKKSPAKVLSHNELLITALDRDKLGIDHIAGVVITDEILDEPTKLLGILKIIKEKLPGRNLYLYHQELGEISEIATDLAIAILFASTKAKLQTDHANLVKLRSKL